MIKKIFSIIFILILSTICVYAVSPSDMTFKADENGKYIYCNNREFILRDDLADVSNPNAKYIMNNESLKADNYTLFVSHVNHTELRDANNNIIEPGFDIEVDVMFKAKSKTTIRIDKLGFEVPRNIKYYLNGRTYTDENEWGCFEAWSNYLGMTINQKDSGQKYYPSNFEPVEIVLNAGETVWLSKYIDNYSAVPFYKPAHIISDFKIISGCCDVNVLALKSNGTLKNRDNLADNISFGAYVYDRQYKGISNSKNVVSTNLNYVITDDDNDGTALPVIVHNQLSDKGNTVTKWFTNLNPRADIWNKANVAEDSMLTLKYEDNSKLNYYGKSVNTKDNIWIFDTLHTDLSQDNSTKRLDRKYIPNSLLSKKSSEETACNLANYGVFYNYNITVENKGNTDRYLSYKLKTESNNIIILYDENGNVVDGYPLCKGNSGSTAEEDTMINIPIPSQKTTNFVISVVLTTNYVGGMQNQLVINNYPTSVESYNTNRNYDVKDFNFTGSEYVKWIDGILYKSNDKINWQKTNMNKETADLFKNQWNEYNFTKFNNCYIAKNSIYDGALYESVKNFFNKFYILDNDFNLVNSYQLYSYSKEVSKANDIIYANTDTKYYLENGQWKNLDSSLELPKYNGKSFVVSYGNGTANLSTTGIYFKPVLFDNFTVEYIQTLNDIYYFVNNNTIYYSYDGVYWNECKTDDYIKKLSRNDTKFIVNDNKQYDILPYQNDIVLRYKDTYLSFKNKIISENEVAYAPTESFEKLTNIKVNSKYIVEYNGISYFPIRQFFEDLGNKVTYHSDYNLIRIE